MKSRSGRAVVNGGRGLGAKRPFDIHSVIRRIRRSVRPLPKAAMFALAEEGHTSLFQQLVACILSIRTRDEVSLVAARRLFEAAVSPVVLASMPRSRIDGLIGDVAFHEAKAGQIREIARETVEKYRGSLPCDSTVVQSFHGVGPKCAHLALGIACGQEKISVDIHVHRIVNRWGYIHARLLSAAWPSSSTVCRRGIGSRSTLSWCRSESTSAPDVCPAAPPVPFSRCADRLE